MASIKPNRRLSGSKKYYLKYAKVAKFTYICIAIA
jgi:hypothetical protein